MKIKDEARELEKMINDSPTDITKNVPNVADGIPELELEPTMTIDVDAIREQSTDEARAMINNAILFMLPPDMIEGNAYLKNKLEVDVMSLSGMIYQLRCNEAMQKAVMEEVRRGAVHPRNFEVFGQLSKIIGDLNKQTLQTVEAVKETYRSVKRDMNEKRTEALGPQGGTMNGLQNTGDGGIVAYGSKELIKEAKRQSQITNANIIPDDPSLGNALVGSYVPANPNPVNPPLKGAK